MKVLIIALKILGWCMVVVPFLLATVRVIEERGGLREYLYLYFAAGLVSGYGALALFLVTR